MAAFGAAVSATAGGAATSVTTGNMNVTGTDLALVAGACEDGSGDVTLTVFWRPAGADVAMTGYFNAGATTGTFLDSVLGYLDNPAAANAPVRANASASIDNLSVAAMFVTAAADIVGTDTATDTAGGTAPSVTVPNVVSGDLVVDFVAVANFPSPVLTVGANQTERINATAGTYTDIGMSTQAGVDGGVMSWTSTTATYGSILIGGRIPDAGGGGGGVGRPMPSRLNRVAMKHFLMR